jgi:acetyltransferase-like isoleucine patch superfamily enzyme
VGRAVFIGYGCAFTGHAAITIADEVMIAHRVKLVTAAGAVVTCEVLPATQVAGVPARVVRGL